MTQISISDAPPETKQLMAHEDAAAHALFAAIAQIGLALRESQEPVAELGGLLATLSGSLGQLRTLVGPGGEGRTAMTAGGTSSGTVGAAARFAGTNIRAIGSAASPGEGAATDLVSRLQSDVFKGIQQLQFYDRLVQHLSHLQDYLISVANELGPLRTPDASIDVWDELHAKLRRRLISDEQRGLLDLFLSPQTATRVPARSERSDYSDPGSMELF